MTSHPLLLSDSERANLWPMVFAKIEEFVRNVTAARVAPMLDPAGLRKELAALRFEQPLSPADAVDLVVRGLWQHQVHVPHPQYYGLFNPAPTMMGIAADALVAAFNPQIAAWSHNPYAAEVEQHLIRTLGEKVGYEAATTEGTFCSGGAEANHTALLAALMRAFPEYKSQGLRVCAKQPVFYVAAEGHHSFQKAGHLSGLGTAACREVPLDDQWRMDVAALERMIRADRQEGLAPFLVVATAGTTNAGIIDPIAQLADVARKEALWLHVDGAWGGPGVLVPELRPALAGMASADSITLDAHKWLSTPMGAGVFLTRHPGVLRATFQSTTTSYMPKEAAKLDVRDPFAHSMQWSRRFIGLKLFLSLAVAGWEGYASVLKEMTARGQQLRQALQEAGWDVVNPTPLPIACFQDGRTPHGREARYLDQIAKHVVDSGKAWISTTRIAGSIPVLRACITNYRTSAADVQGLVGFLEEARQAVVARNES